MSECKISKWIDVLCSENILFYNFVFDIYCMKNYFYLDLFLLVIRIKSLTLRNTFEIKGEVSEILCL